MKRGHQKHILEPRRETPVVPGRFDVVVVGGGPAGFGAAIGAARAGAKVLLVERYGFLGGQATNALVGPFSRIDDGKRIVIKGIVLELLRGLRKMGGALPALGPDLFPDKGFFGWVAFDAELYKYLSAKLVTKAGVEILLHSYAVKPALKGKKIVGVIVENKSGRSAVLGKVVIDATGDGDIAARAGVPYDKGDPKTGKLQPMTLQFVLGGVEAVPLSLGAVREKMRKDQQKGILPLRVFRGDSWYYGVSLRLGEGTMNVVRQLGDATDVRDLTRAELEGREEMMTLIRYFKKRMPGFERCFLLKSGVQIGVRETRRILGEYVLGEKDIVADRSKPDVVAKGCYAIDVHDSSGKGVEADRVEDLEAGKHYDIPYRCLVPLKIENLLVAGRCISTTRAAQGSVRVMSHCMATGQAAGVAAAVSARSAKTPRAVDVKAVQRELIKQEVFLC